MTANGHLLDRPVAGSATQPGMPAAPRPLHAGHMDFAALETAPFWARKYTRLLLGYCGISPETTQTAEQVVSELVANAFLATGSAPGTRLTYSERANTAVIRLILGHFRHGLLIEVIDSSPNPPILINPERDTEHGRGLWLVNALSREWGHFPVPNGGKCVYSILDITS